MITRATTHQTPFSTGRLDIDTSPLCSWRQKIAIALTLCAGLHAGIAYAADVSSDTTLTGPVRLLVPNQPGSSADTTGLAPLTPSQRETVIQQQQQLLLQLQMLLQPVPGQPLTRDQLAARAARQTDFERHVQRAVGDDIEIKRFGAELMTPTLPQPYELQQLPQQLQRSSPLTAGEGSNQVPSDYVISVGDEVIVTLWGAVDADLRLTVDRGGRITIPRVGPVLVAGIRYAELNAAVEQRVAQVFRNFRLSASLGKLRSIRIYVTGFTQKPGAYTVSSLSTIASAVIQAGGPSSAGSFRNLELRRGGKLISNFDLYDLLLRGDRSRDSLLQADDVVHIGPVGEQVALIGSVNRQAIFELKPGETLNDLLLMGGGLSAAADRGRVAIESMQKRNAGRVAEAKLPHSGNLPLHGGDVVRAFNALDTLLPQHKQNKRVRVDGEVQQPGEYILPPNSTLNDVINAAGGLTQAAFVYGAELNRESVRISQQNQYDRALRDLEGEFARASVKPRGTAAPDDPAALSNRGPASSRLIDRLRAVRLTGRVVMQLAPNANSLPELAVEDGDRLTIPTRPTTVGVFGSVYNTGSYAFSPGASVDDMLRLAGGPTRGADASGAFVIRANGHVVSARQQSSGWLSSGTALSTVSAQPGDTIFVPEDLTKVTFSQEAKEWTQILYQFGLGAAALNSLKN